MDKKFIFHTR